jgi:hypothetical protein
MDTKSPYEEINVEYKGRQFKIYVYKHLNFIKDSTIFLIKTSPVIERHIRADEDYNYLRGVINCMDKCSQENDSIYNAVISAIWKHFYHE